MHEIVELDITASQWLMLREYLDGRRGRRELVLTSVQLHFAGVELIGPKCIPRARGPDNEKGRKRPAGDSPGKLPLDGTVRKE